MELIVRNLIDNALKNSGTATSATIHIHCQALTEECVQIRVEDHGKGMPADKLTYLQNILAGHISAQVGQMGLGLGMILIRDFTHLANLSGKTLLQFFKQ